MTELSCSNCKWCSCVNYGRKTTICVKFIPDKVDEDDYHDK